MVVAKARALGLDTLASQVVVGYVVLYLIVLVLILWRTKGASTKLVWAGFVTVLFALPVTFIGINVKQYEEKVAVENSGYMAKFTPAKAIFDKLCAEQSQPIIKRTVEDVEGVLLLKVRPEPTSRNAQVADQMWEGAGLPSLPHGNWYIGYFLRDRKLDDKYSNKIRDSVGALDHRRGFRFADVRDPATGGTTRFTAKMVQESGVNRPEVKLVSAALSGSFARYAIDLIDNVDPALREHWIAGTTIRVIDTKNKETIAEQTWWNWDAGFGNSNQRSPWLLGKTCPNDSGPETGLRFVDSVLHAKQGN